MASRLGPAHPLATAWKGAGRPGLIFSQSRPVNFSRTVSIAFPLARLRFQCPGHVLAELAQTVAAATFAGRRRIDHHAFARKVVGECIALGTFAREPGDIGRLGDHHLRREFIFHHEKFQFLERRATTDQSDAPSVPTVARKLALAQLGDPPFLLGDQRRVFRRLGPGDRQLRGDLQDPWLQPDGQRRLQDGDGIGREHGHQRS